MGKLGNIWKTMLAGGAGVAALAALNAAIQRNASDPDESALGGEAHFFRWKHGRVFYKVSGTENSGPPLVFIHGIGAGSSSFMWRKNFDELVQGLSRLRLRPAGLRLFRQAMPLLPIQPIFTSN